MLDLSLATNMEIQVERDNANAMMAVTANDWWSGLTNFEEYLGLFMVYSQRYQECTDRLLRDWDWAVRVAEQLE